MPDLLIVIYLTYRYVRRVDLPSCEPRNRLMPRSPRADKQSENYSRDFNNQNKDLGAPYLHYSIIYTKALF